MRVKKTNEVEANTIKLLMNSLYGKACQRLVESEIKIVKKLTAKNYDDNVKKTI